MSNFCTILDFQNGICYTVFKCGMQIDLQIYKRTANSNSRCSIMRLSSVVFNALALGPRGAGITSRSCQYSAE